MAPLIGISCRLVSDSPGVPPVHGVRSSYLESIEAAGGLPVMIPLLEKEESLRSLYGLCSGLLLPGGEDVDPAHYGEAPHEKLGSVCAERDRVELQLVQWARQDRKPIQPIVVKTGRQFTLPPRFFTAARTAQRPPVLQASRAGPFFLPSPHRSDKYARY